MLVLYGIELNAQPFNSDHNQLIAIPSYIYPGPAWSQIEDAFPTVGLAIINPNSGPSTVPSVISDYQNQLLQSQSNGLTIIAYVHTNYGNRSINQVQNDIDLFYNQFPNIDGIFFDEVPNGDCSTINYYQTLYNHVKGKGGIGLVVLNPGAQTQECFMNVCDIIVNFEQTFVFYQNNYSQPEWVRKYSSNRFWHLIHTTPNENDMKQAIHLSKQRNAGWVYITNDVMPNPWDNLPSGQYWVNELIFARNEIQNLSHSLEKGNDAGGRRITKLGNPIGPFDAVTKSYVDMNDEVNDADHIIGNEYNSSVSLDHTTLKIADGGGIISVDLSTLVNDNDWLISGNNLSSLVSGNVGVGVSSPTQKLDINGNLKVRYGKIIGSNTNNYLQLTQGHSPIKFFIGNQMKVRFDIDNDFVFLGKLFYSEGLYQYSDKKLKIAIKPLKSSLDKISLLRGVSYNWNVKDYSRMNFDNNRQIGFIAQEVEKVFPEVVRVSDENLKVIKYNQFIPVLIEAIKEQKKIIEQQGLLLEELTTLNSQIIKRLEVLEKISNK